jgi:hypothetical protein
MTFIQKFFTRIFPRAWAEEMRAESEQWIVRCTCGFERSVWEMGGIRWKAAGNPRWRRKCPHCGQVTWHTVEKDSINR